MNQQIIRKTVSKKSKITLEVKKEAELLESLDLHESVVSLNNRELAKQLELRPKKVLSMFKKIPVNQRGFVLLHLSKGKQQLILKGLSIQEIIKFLHYLDLESASQIIHSIDKERRELISQELGEDLKEKLKTLAKIDPDRVEHLMDLNYIEIETATSLENIAKIIIQYEKKTGRFPTILIVQDGYFVGSLPGHALAIAKDQDSLFSYVRDLPTVKYSDGPKDIIKAFRDTKHDKIVVLNDDDSILGVIYSEEVMGLIEKETAKNLYAFAGLNQSEDIEDKFNVKVKFRYKWLILNLFTSFLAASVVTAFEGTISKMVLLAAYMPIVAGMGGNAATQTLAVVVRGLATKTITRQKLYSIVKNEMAAGLINGLITAVLVGIIGHILNGSWALGLVAGAAVVFNLVIAAFFGTVIPIVLQKLGKDPASSATIFITTATDVFGFMFFLGLANFVF
jgi:magnesium transporter